jgi:hypothetical protein
MIYHPELAIKETTDTASSASFLDLYLEIDDSEIKGFSFMNLLIFYKILKKL